MLSIDLSIGGFFGGYDWVIGDGDVMKYYQQTFWFSDSNKDFVEIIPTETQYQAFISYLDIIKSWKKRYDNNDILDGCQWHVKIKYKDIIIDTYGSNSYPPNFGEFCRKVSELIGELWGFEPNEKWIDRGEEI
jgi:hypothetical protein